MCASSTSSSEKNRSSLCSSNRRDHKFRQDKSSAVGGGTVPVYRNETDQQTPARYPSASVARSSTVDHCFANHSELPPPAYTEEPQSMEGATSFITSNQSVPSHVEYKTKKAEKKSTKNRKEISISDRNCDEHPCGFDEKNNPYNAHARAMTGPGGPTYRVKPNRTKRTAPVHPQTVMAMPVAMPMASYGHYSPVYSPMGAVGGSGNAWLPASPPSGHRGPSKAGTRKPRRGYSDPSSPSSSSSSSDDGDTSDSSSDSSDSDSDSEDERKKSTFNKSKKKAQKGQEKDIRRLAKRMKEQSMSQVYPPMVPMAFAMPMVPGPSFAAGLGQQIMADVHAQVNGSLQNTLTSATRKSSKRHY